MLQTNVRKIRGTSFSPHKLFRSKQTWSSDPSYYNRWVFSCLLPLVIWLVWRFKNQRKFRHSSTLQMKRYSINRRHYLYIGIGEYGFAQAKFRFFKLKPIMQCAIWLIIIVTNSVQVIIEILEIMSFTHCSSLLCLCIYLCVYAWTSKLYIF